ncbi:MAG: F0F1 ATP synthase subunit delta [Candidatus Omnitrophica bacterium]|nr:F0F1 ATP synthase subunit delta [Candidatus Omnitrophota bacterium]
MTLLAPVLVLLFIGGLLFLVMRHVLTRHFTQATGHLYTLSQETLAQQETLKKKMLEGDRHYQEQLAKAQEEGNKIKNRILSEAELAKQQVIDEARREAERIVQQALQTRQALQKELSESMESKAVEWAGQLLEGALPEELREAAHAQWVDGLMKNGLVKTEGLSQKSKVDKAKVVSAFPLTPAQKKLLGSRLQEAMGLEVKLEEEVDARLVAGLVITLGDLVFDGSLASRLKEIARHAQNRIQ